MLAVMSDNEAGIDRHQRQSGRATTPRARSAGLDRFLLAAGIVGSLFFFVVVLVEGAIRPGYDAWRHPISTLALGPQGWTLTTALLVLGVGVLCLAAGLRRALHPGRGSTWGPVLLALPAVAWILEGFFPTDPGLGYPPGAPTASTVHGTVHLVLSVLFESPPLVAACIVVARRFAQAAGGRPWVIYSIATVVLIVVFDILGNLAYLRDPSWYGLFQRLEIFTALAWVVLLAGRLLIGPRPEVRRASPPDQRHSR